MSDPLPYQPPHSHTRSGDGATPILPTPGFILPDRIDRYEVRELLGYGGFGFVVRADDPTMEREVAIKMPHPHLTANPQSRARFIQEARAAGKLRHPNICQVYDVGNLVAAGNPDGTPYIVMEYIRGQTMHRLLADLKTRNRRMTVRQACDLLRVIAAAVDFAHGKGIIHRDLKPPNILIDADRKQPVVMDFGLARLSDGGLVSTTPGMAAGTAAYMSREQWEGRRDAIGPHTDVYALGVMMYECLTGRHPYDGAEGMEFFGRMVSPDPSFAPPNPTALRSNIDPRLGEIVLRAIRTDYRERYATAKDLAAAIVASLRAADEPPPPTMPPRDPEQEALDADWKAYEAAVLLNKRADMLKSTAPTRVTAWRKAAERGEPAGILLYGESLHWGFGVSQDIKAALSWFRKAAERGNPAGMIALGHMHQEGHGVTKDEAAAVKWYQKAADAGHAAGMFNLGVMYAKGRGVPKDEAAAVKWYQKAADAGHAAGMSNLGFMYEKGQGVAKDEAAAVKWYQKAAERGNLLAMHNLGLLYQNGRGVPQDYAEAVKWYKMAADGGDPSGMNSLGVVHQQGWGVPQDYAEAVKWYKKAADGGNANGMTNLGLMYENGRGGLPQDDVEAVKWYLKAAELGSESAKTALKRVAKK